MSFARAVVAAVLIIQIIGILREIFFAISFAGYLNGLTGGDPAIISGTVVLIGSILLLVPVWRGNRWATAASIPLLALLLLAVLPVFAEFWGRPAEDFPIWFTITTLLVSAGLGIPFAVVATLEAFGRRMPSRLRVSDSGFSPGALAATAVAASLAGMLLLGAAVATSPAEGSATAFERAPDEMLVVRMSDLRFDPAEIRVATGITTALFVVNDDPAGHSFDVDELDLHVTVGGNQTAVVLVTPEQAGSYELYCGVAGHAEAGMVGTLVVE